MSNTESTPQNSLFSLFFRHFSVILFAQMLMILFFQFLVQIAYSNSHLPDNYLEMDHEERRAVHLDQLQKIQEISKTDPDFLTKEYYRILIEESNSLLLWGNILWFLSFLIPAYYFLHKWSNGPLPDWNANIGLKEILWGMAGGFIVFLVVTIIAGGFQLFGIKIEGNQSQKLLLSSLKGKPIFLAWTLYTVGLVTGLLEEVFFRGFLLTHYEKIGNSMAGLHFTSIIFGLMHYSPDASLLAPFILIVVGYLFGYIYLRTKNIWIVSITHATYNSIDILLAYFFGDVILK